MKPNDARHDADRVLAKMLDERAHLQIRINLLNDPDMASGGSLTELQGRLREVEAQIDAQRQVIVTTGSRRAQRQPDEPQPEE